MTLPLLRLDILTIGSSTQTARTNRRIHLPPAFLKSCKLAAGDFVVIKAALDPDHFTSLSLNGAAASHKATSAFTLAQAWPSVHGDEDHVLQGAFVSPSKLLQLQEISLGDSVSVSPLISSGLLGAELVSVIVTPQAAEQEDNKAQNKLLLAYIKHALADLKCVVTGEVFDLTFGGKTRSYIIRSLAYDPARATAQLGLVTASTQISLEDHILPQVHMTAAPSDPVEAYSQVGGLNTQIQHVRELVELPFTRPEIYRHFGLQPPKGILFYGPPGTGKTLLAAAIANSLGIPKFLIAGASLSSPFHGETESKLREVFTQAKTHRRSIVIIDEVDALAPKREDSGEVERRVVAELLTLMDGLDDKPASQTEEPARVLVIACTNRPHAIDPALRRPGRFDKEIEIGIPDADARLSILNVHLRSAPHRLPASYVATLASRTHGFVGADIASIVQSASLQAIRRCIAANLTLSDMRLQEADLEASLLITQPSAMREVFVEVPSVHWADVGGQDEVKQNLKEAIEWPLLHKATFERLGAKPPSGILLYGPPGCSKTLMAKAVATESGLNFMSIKGPEILNKYVGESERAVRELFRKARSNAPSVLFLDEIDVIASTRSDDDHSGSSRVLTTLLTEMDGIEDLQGVVILAATNRPWSIDSALLRPGRLDRLLFVGAPDIRARHSIFKITLAKMSVDTELDIDQLASLANDCSGAEIVAICQNAALAAMNEDMQAAFIKDTYFYEAAKAIRRRITREDIVQYEEWRDQVDV